MKKITLDNYRQHYRYKYVVENIKDVIWELDADLFFTYISPACKEMTGYNADELTGKRMTDFLFRSSGSMYWAMEEKRTKQKIL